MRTKLASLNAPPITHSPFALLLPSGKLNAPRQTDAAASARLAGVCFTVPGLRSETQAALGLKLA